jgi:hypothetical protein
MPFASDTVHGLSADVYYNAVQQRVFGDIVISSTIESLPLTANDEGNVNPVDVLRRGENVMVTVPFADASSIAAISGVYQPFSLARATTSGTEVVLPKAAAGDSFVDEAQELRLVLRDGSATWIFPAAVATDVADLTLSEENQMVQAITFQCFRSTVSGIETPFRILSGAVITGPPA